MSEEQATCGRTDSISEKGEDKPKGKFRPSARFDISENEEFHDMPRERGKRESKISVSDITVARQRRQSIAENIKFRIVNPVRRLSKSVQETLHTYASKRRGKRSALKKKQTVRTYISIIFLLMEYINRNLDATFRICLINIVFRLLKTIPSILFLSLTQFKARHCLKQGIMFKARNYV